MKHAQEYRLRGARPGWLRARWVSGLQRAGRPNSRALELWLSGAIIVLAMLLAVAAPLLTPHSPTDNSLVKALKPPFWIEGGSTEFLLGTDRFGRDVLTRILYGLRISLLVSLLGGALLAIVGVTLGVISGYFGGLIDALIQRLAETTLALPGILVALVLGVTLGPGFGNILVIILLVYWGRVALPVRAEVLSIRERGFVRLARVANAGPLYIIQHHVFPHVRDTAVVLLTLVLGHLILIEASLSFLGVGIPPPTPSLGSMVADGLQVLERGWWISLFPGIAMTLIVVAANLLGDWLRDHWDPRLQDV